MKDFPSRPVVISGIGETAFFKGGRVPGTPKSAKQLLVEAAVSACADAGVEPAAIDGLLQWGGGGIAAEEVINALGITDLRLHAAINIGGASIVSAVSTAALLVSAGAATRILVALGRDSHRGARMSVAEGSMAKAWPSPRIRDHIEYPAGFGVPMQWYSLHANRWFHETGADPEGLKAVALATRAHAHHNERAYFRGRGLTSEEYDRAPVYTRPFRLYDISLESDGGAALVVEAERTDRSGHRRKAYIAGGGEGHPDTPDDLSSRTDVLGMGITKVARRVLPALGVTTDDIDFAEIYDCFTFIVLRQLEELGFADRGSGPDWVRETGIGPGGGLPVNTHGGLLSQAHLAGITHVTEAVKQLRGTAGAGQLAAPRVGLVTGYGDWGDGSLVVLHS